VRNDNSERQGSRPLLTEPPPPPPRGSTCGRARVNDRKFIDGGISGNCGLEARTMPGCFGRLCIDHSNATLEYTRDLSGDLGDRTSRCHEMSVRRSRCSGSASEFAGTSVLSAFGSAFLERARARACEEDSRPWKRQAADESRAFHGIPFRSALFARRNALTLRKGGMHSRSVQASSGNVQAAIERRMAT